MARRPALFAAVGLALVAPFLTAMSGGAGPDHCPAPVRAQAPFFDRQDTGSGDTSPRPPEISELDEQVLDYCGDWGRPLDRKSGRRWLASLIGRDAKLSRSLQRLPGNDRITPAEISAAWFDEGGFRHIFCGEPDRRSRDGCPQLGGFHYAPRYKQAESEGWAGPLQPGDARRSGWCKAQDWGARDGIVSLPVWFEAGSSTALKCITGYAVDLDAAAMLEEVTKAWLNARMRFGRSGTTACLHRLPKRRLAVFVLRDGAILTFYPILKQRRNMPYCAK